MGPPSRHAGEQSVSSTPTTGTLLFSLPLTSFGHPVCVPSTPSNSAPTRLPPAQTHHKAWRSRAADRPTAAVTWAPAVCPRVQHLPEQLTQLGESSLTRSWLLTNNSGAARWPGCRGRGRDVGGAWVRVGQVEGGASPGGGPWGGAGGALVVLGVWARFRSWAGPGQGAWSVGGAWSGRGLECLTPNLYTLSPPRALQKAQPLSFPAGVIISASGIKLGGSRQIGPQPLPSPQRSEVRGWR